jgi:allantoicase
VTDIADLVDLADERLGGAALFASDDFFAPKENLLKPTKPVFLPHEYTDRGKWMDGWESRRKRVPGHDDCIVRLGLPGRLERVVVDTAFFRGNYPDRCALEGCFVRSDASLATLLDPATEWFPLLAESKLRGDSENVFALEGKHAVSHVRLRIYPDGGVARLRLLGTVVPDFRALGGTGNELDVAALEAGGRVLTCSDMFFGPKHNLILPGRSLTMEGGWETKRRRGPGHDWVIVALTGAARIARVEIDTNHFKGNYPDTASLEGWDARAADVGEVVDWSAVPWVPLLARTKLEAHTRHFFVEELLGAGPFTHLRLAVYPDGGVSRLRVHGVLTDDARRARGLEALEAATPLRARQVLEGCCGAKTWVEAMVARRPYPDVATFLATSDEAFSRLGDDDWFEAFSHHPRIGESRAARAAAAEAVAAQARRSSEGEQAGVRGAGEALLQALREGNEAYERKFGFLYLVCASGKSAEELVGTLEHRLTRDRATELATAKDEQRAITRLRLEKLLRP